MKRIWVVYMDDVPEYASYDWHDAHNRYVALLSWYGDIRVKMNEGYVEED